MFFTRLQLEEIEDKSLASYGMRSKDSKGRAYLDSEPDYRTSFQRDRDRILHTTAFRRLEYKTQVFINFEGDYFRTRLTHTLEVAQIGRTLARALGANEDLVETICLAHDLGHSPFGHSGEIALARLMKEVGGFDHNKQSLRIVTELEQRYPEFPGLNLTWEVREGMVKHESEYDISDARDFSPDLRGNLETQIANVADELAYTTHDLDDGLRSGMITPQILEGISLWEILRETYKWQGHILSEMERHRMIRQLVGLMVTDMLQATDVRIKDSKVKTALDIQKLKHNIIGYSEEMQRRNRELKDLLYKKLYRHYRVVRMQTKAERVISELFHAYQAEPSMLPDHVQFFIEKRGLERTICDYIAGMTDRYAVEEHQKLFNPSEKP
ncbi:MAG: deoxyguanosinetriphosphate triphosphohydrolase [Anaerolineales bacterium]|jgi:dGTPase|uniref:deoxyguanosinetriphosphate triphosphohydrolase n=1 Tax=Candidatus Villigracilis affinis TaxID=3140682 RepID=UPI001B6FF664|nr:deoxyguanosinetriphosphate triphosphohydrolase [Anaerolineales bacterium]MBK9601096.1 deoxyguanosinetriphosphate triphosphohydrolase [Anaerolineales bacterium]MBL0347703.1 deoxyguanosinetriphosphate triphosphohydrolase [Anaerolineales bacterium]MBP8047917.1 deoxyguanosinetriphosphate triphosphohydrolase [Anaerolineales bacterium]